MVAENRTLWATVVGQKQTGMQFQEAPKADAPWSHDGAKRLGKPWIWRFSVGPHTLESKMKQSSRWLLLGSSAVALVFVGGAVDRFLMEQTVLNASFANVFFRDTLLPGRSSFPPMKMLADGKMEAAFTMLEGQVLASALSLSLMPGATEEAKREADDYVRRVRGFYESHPDRKAALQSKFPDYFNLIESWSANK